MLSTNCFVMQVQFLTNSQKAENDPALSKKCSTIKHLLRAERIFLVQQQQEHYLILDEYHISLIEGFL